MAVGLIRCAAGARHLPRHAGSEWRMKQHGSNWAHPVRFSRASTSNITSQKWACDGAFHSPCLGASALPRLWSRLHSPLPDTCKDTLLCQYQTMSCKHPFGSCITT